MAHLTMVLRCIHAALLHNTIGHALLRVFSMASMCMRAVRGVRKSDISADMQRASLVHTQASIEFDTLADVQISFNR